MSEETYTVEEWVRLKHDQKVIVLKQGEKIPMARAVELGLVKKPSGKGGK
jgi:hypothetical protein